MLPKLQRLNQWYTETGSFSSSGMSHKFQEGRGDLYNRALDNWEYYRGVKITIREVALPPIPRRAWGMLESK